MDNHTTTNNAEFSSLASTSALVSETILDQLEIEQMASPSQRSEQEASALPDSRGVNSHQYDTERLKNMLSNFGSETHHEQHEEPERTPSSSSAEDLIVHPSHYQKYLRHKENKQRKRELRLNEAKDNIRKSSNQQKGPQPCTVPESSSTLSTISTSTAKSNDSLSFHMPWVGLITSTQQWFASQRIERQRKELDEAVEHQRRIILKEVLKDQQKEVEKFHDYDLSDEDDDHNGLRYNATFQTITGNSSNLSFSPKRSSSEKEDKGIVARYANAIVCGSHSRDSDDGSSDGDYYAPSAPEYAEVLEKKLSISPKSLVDESIDTDDEEHMSAITEKTHDTMSTARTVVTVLDEKRQCDSTILPDTPNSTTSTTSSSNDTNSPHRPDLIRISSPKESFTGQGVAVHFELEKRKKRHRRRKKSKSPPKVLNDSEDDDIEVHHVKIHRETSKVPFLLTEEQMREIAMNGLPLSVMFSKWRRLYSLQRDGDNFSCSFLQKVQDAPRSLLVVQTTNLDVFGAFVDSPWEVQPGSHLQASYYGSAQASLFSIDQKSGEVKIYKWTGKNRYIQLCDPDHRLIALGGGGKDCAFGLCVEDDFRVGSTGPCETFGNESLCGQEQFDILNVECWGFMAEF